MPVDPDLQSEPSRLEADVVFGEDFEGFREAMDESRVESVIIHAIYLINCATPESRQDQ